MRSIGANTDHAGALGARQQFSQPEDHAALVLRQNLDRADQVHRDDEQDGQNGWHDHHSTSIHGRQTFRTVRVRPSTRTTAIESPSPIGSAAVAVQISPCVATRPILPGSIEVSARPGSPITPATPVTGARRCDATPRRTSTVAMKATATRIGNKTED